MELHDLPPARDPKGGSPKSPSPIPVSQYESEVYGGGAFSKFTPIIISVLCTALIGMTIAWWTALSERGVNRRDMEEYVRTYSPYVIDKGLIAEHQTTQDKEIARIGTVQSEVVKRLDKLEAERDGINHP